MAGFNIMDIFRGGAQAPNGQTPVQPPVVATPAQTQQQAVQSGVPQALAGTPAAEGAVQSPMDEFTKAFENDPKRDNPRARLEEPLFTLDPTKLQEAASKMDFTKSINPELAQKALQGDPAALIQLLNGFGQNLMTHNLTMATKVTEQGVDARLKNYDQFLPDRVRTLQVDDTLAANPAFQHAAVQPMINNLRSQFIQAYPDATPSQIASMVGEYVQKFAASVAPTKQPSQEEKQAASASDFSGFFGAR